MHAEIAILRSEQKVTAYTCINKIMHEIDELRHINPEVIQVSINISTFI